MAAIATVSAEGAPSHGLGATACDLRAERVIVIQRTRILAAMVEECGGRGPGSVTVAHVVERAGISRRTFYEIFSDREDCLLAAFEDVIARVSNYVLSNYDPGVSWVLRIRTALTALLSFLDIERDAGRLLLVGSLGAGPGVLKRRQDLLAQVMAAVEEGRKSSKGGNGLPSLTAESVVGGVLSVLHARLLEEVRSQRLIELTGSLMAIIVLPYLGPAAARRELTRAAPRTLRGPELAARDPLRELGMRLTYRTVRVLAAVAAQSGGSNRQVANAAGIADQGQISKLLARLERLGLIEKVGRGSVRGTPNAWALTTKGREVQGVLVHDNCA